MQKNTNIIFPGNDLMFPDVKILQYNYYRNIRFWQHHARNSPFWHLYWNDQPGGHFHCGERKYDLTPEYIYLLPPHTTFSTSASGVFGQFYLHFVAGGEFLRVVQHEIVLPLPTTKELFVAQLAKAQNRSGLFSLFAYGIVFDTLLQLPEECFSPEAPLDPRIQRAITLLRSSLERDLSNAQVARHVGMSENNFIRVFVRTIGISPQRYRLNARLEQAGNLLLQQKYSIDEIAALLGFSDRFHFSHTFKRVFLTSPAFYRRQFLAQENK